MKQHLGGYHLIWGSQTPWIREVRSFLWLAESDKHEADAGAEGGRKQGFHHAGPRRQPDLSPKAMAWHAGDHRRPSNVKWLWMEAEGDRWSRAGREVLAAPQLCSAGWAGGYHDPGQALATCSSPRPAWIITCQSLIVQHASVQANNRHHDPPPAPSQILPERVSPRTPQRKA